jgi:two-component system, NarL family, invasion response regulator UvrY
MRKFLLVDDHAVVRSGLKLFISSLYINSEIDEAPDGDVAFKKIKSKDYDLVILDIHMPNTDTTGLITNILSFKPSLKILVFSMGTEGVYAKRYLKLGVKGFLNKECPTEEISKAIDTILQSKRYLSEDLIEKLTNDSVSDRSDNPFNELSNRELEIALLLLNGKSVGEIVELLHIQNSTVGTHKARIFEKLQVGNVIDLRELAKIHQVI